mmetsp:Transcript_5435/g.11539  ORF Transcript_5435/g.11539 Transcript_5435/m.11539 type:complete len:340 (-) Transcript_5435:688-1707(-)
MIPLLTSRTIVTTRSISSKRVLLICGPLWRCCCTYLYLASTTQAFGSFGRVTAVPSSNSAVFSPTRSIMSCSATEQDHSDSPPAVEATTVGLTDLGSDDATTATVTTTTTTDSSMTSWRDKIVISMAKSRKVRGGNYVQIATVDPESLEPRCRTVVFRGFLKVPNREDHKMVETNQMKMITDQRSNKYTEVTTSASSSSTKASTCEMVWWFGKSSEQYRIRGLLQFVGAHHEDATLVTARKEQWGNLSDAAREQFYWTSPGVPLQQQQDPVDIPVGGRDDEGRVLPPPDNFLLMLLVPQRCDYLRLGDNYRQVDTLRAKSTISHDGNEKEEWDIQPVTP